MHKLHRTLHLAPGASAMFQQAMRLLPAVAKSTQVMRVGMTVLLKGSGSRALGRRVSCLAPSMTPTARLPKRRVTFNELGHS